MSCRRRGVARVSARAQRAEDLELVGAEAREPAVSLGCLRAVLGELRTEGRQLRGQVRRQWAVLAAEVEVDPQLGGGIGLDATPDHLQDVPVAEEARAGVAEVAQGGRLAAEPEQVA